MNLLEQDQDPDQEKRIRSVFLPQKMNHVNVANTSSVRFPTEYGLSTQGVTASAQGVTASTQGVTASAQGPALSNNVSTNNGTITLDLLSMKPEDSEVNSGWIDKFLS